MTTRRTLALAVVLVALAGGCTDDGHDDAGPGPAATSTPTRPTPPVIPSQPAPPTEPAVPPGTVVDGHLLQVVDQGGRGRAVRVDQVIAPRAVHVVVREDEGGRPGAVLGSAAVPASRPQAADVVLSRPLDRSRLLWVVLHADTDGDGQFAGPDDDPLVRTGLGILGSRIRYELRRG